MQVSERIFTLAGSILAASSGVSVERAVLVAEVIVDLCRRLGREKVLEVMLGEETDEAN